MSWRPHGDCAVSTECLWRVIAFSQSSSWRSTACSRRAHGALTESSRRLGVVRACLRRAHFADRAPNTCTEHKSCDIQTPSSVDCFPSPLDTIHVIITTSSLHIGMVGKKKGTRGRGKKTLASPEPYSPPPSPHIVKE